MEKTYISGKISGIEAEAFELFADAETHLIKSGHIAVNPMTLKHEHDKNWHAFMKEDVKALCDCDNIYMLNNWTDSKGAIIEHSIAILLGIKPIYQAPHKIQE